MEIDYTNSRADYLAHFKATQRASFARMSFHHYFWVSYWGVMAALGVYASFLAGLIFLAMIIVAMYFLFLTQAIPYGRVWRTNAEKASKAASPKKVHLRIDDEGLHETVEGQVESYAPWPALRRFLVVDDHLLIELAGDLWANVPRQTVTQGTDAFDELVADLRQRGLPEGR